MSADAYLEAIAEADRGRLYPRTKLEKLLLDKGISVERLASRLMPRRKLERIVSGEQVRVGGLCQNAIYARLNVLVKPRVSFRDVFDVPMRDGRRADYLTDYRLVAKNETTGWIWIPSDDLEFSVSGDFDGEVSLFVTTQRVRSSITAIATYAAPTGNDTWRIPSSAGRYALFMVKRIKRGVITVTTKP